MRIGAARGGSGAQRGAAPGGGELSGCAAKLSPARFLPQDYGAGGLHTVSSAGLTDEARSRLQSELRTQGWCIVNGCLGDDRWTEDDAKKQSEAIMNRGNCGRVIASIGDWNNDMHDNLPSRHYLPVVRGAAPVSYLGKNQMAESWVGENSDRVKNVFLRAATKLFGVVAAKARLLYAAAGFTTVPMAVSQVAHCDSLFNLESSEFPDISVHMIANVSEVRRPFSIISGSHTVIEHAYANLHITDPGEFLRSFIARYPDHWLAKPENANMQMAWTHALLAKGSCIIFNPSCFHHGRENILTSVAGGEVHAAVSLFGISMMESR
ncbi:hypothetical protein T484DRAFT_1854424 [Baffinella frigidus]|nr:hypothetical protein T484DRAFT_1854424 [Cryptophyta sp. CCMP2293]